MPRRWKQPRRDRTVISLFLDRSVLEHIDNAARVLHIDRQAVLLRGVDLLTFSTSVVLRDGDEVSGLAGAMMAGKGL